MAIKVVDAALRDDFGFDHIMWVYSGRRGAHAWISDKRAREMDDQKRKALAGYLEVIKGGAQSGKKVNVKRPLHPHLAYVPNCVLVIYKLLIMGDATAGVSISSKSTSRPIFWKIRTLGLRPRKPNDCFNCSLTRC